MKEPRLLAGDLVTVRAFREIAATLDATGALEGLPFLPEMMKYCGLTFRSLRPVNKLIQEGVGSSMRRIKDVVLLDGPSCDGRAHGDCQRACFPLWKTAWLRPAGDRLEIDPYAPDQPFDAAPDVSLANLSTGRTCQVTELMRATSPLPIWDPRRYYWDLVSGTYEPLEYLTYLLGGIYRKTLKRIVTKFAGKTDPSPVALPSEPLGLEPGDWVEVKSAEGIRLTLDPFGKARGLYFMPNMWKYCGRKLRVLQPIERMMSEKTGELRSLEQTVLLERATCTGKDQGGCQRVCYIFWKEAWLKRVAEPGETPKTLEAPHENNGQVT